MLFHPTPIASAYLIDVEKRADDRGFFGRAWCSREFGERGMATSFVQGNIGASHKKGTLRGMHYQVAPHEEAKLVRCTRGAVWDVLLDVRADSPTFGQSFGVELSADTHRMLYIPPGCAHGYQALTDDVEVFYLVSAFYTPEAERGIRFDDPAFGIEWPLPVTVISEKDRTWPDFAGR